MLQCPQITDQPSGKLGTQQGRPALLRVLRGHRSSSLRCASLQAWQKSMQAMQCLSLCVQHVRRHARAHWNSSTNWFVTGT